MASDGAGSAGRGVAEWPDEEFVREALADASWEPSPFTQFVVKVHGRCNLSCDYCYVYEMADQSWREKPATMPAGTLRQAASRIAEHAAAHRLDVVDVLFHGGEALMAGPAHLKGAAAVMNAMISPVSRVRLRVQTNGILLTEAMLRVLAAADIQVGVSIDGDARAHDRHRRYASGKGSHAAVLAGLSRLRQPAYKHLFGCIYCTIDISNDPLETYQTLLEQTQAPGMDFLLPHGNWAYAPPGLGSGTPYADWLIAIFDQWYSAPRQQTRIRIFENILDVVLGGESRYEGMGLSPLQFLTVDTDGSIEQVDSMKSAFEGAPATGLNVFDHTFDAALLHPGVVARQRGLAALCSTCLSCPVHQICGGGMYTHRYRPGSGFLNPSVYCADLLRLVEYIRDTVHADLLTTRERP
jgi:uncharacterized protein